MTISKSALRARIQKSQPMAGQTWPEEWDRALCDWLKSQPPGIWGAFAPLKDEPPLSQSLQTLTHLDWVFPRVVGKELEFCRVAENEWVRGPFSKEPSAQCQVIPSVKIQGLLIPGMAFDDKGNRLGRGGGFYDRFLQAFTGIRVGVVHSSRVLEEVPADVWDQRVEWIATEKGVLKALAVANPSESSGKKEF